MGKEKESPVRKQLAMAVTAWVFAGLLALLFAANLVVTPPEISKSERRYLADFPKLFTTQPGSGTTGGLNPEFSGQFETWAMDSFAFREAFRSMKAVSVYHIFRQKDNNGVYLIQGHAGKLETLNEDSVRRAGKKISIVMNLLPEDANVWYSIIPDKGYYLNQLEGNLPSVDYERAAQFLAETLGTEGYVNLLPALAANDFYRTDLHWSQVKLLETAQALGSKMGFSDRLDMDFKSHSLSPFYGVYYGQAALPLPAEELVYLTSPVIEQAVVKYLDSKTMKLVDGKMYLIEKFDGIDPYDLFLGGAQPLITIENSKAETDKELILFRDSFGSSLAPLLTSAYSKITLIDLRYVDSRVLGQLVDFGEDPDVLFLYSTQILNQSDSLLVTAR